ncbi:MAG TPA: FtsX-like permease family protein [Candidatus Limnocylindrales bacterium]|nr:FtsX-like permease family protein [Candidatus Limnocylindrales bacterium]
MKYLHLIWKNAMRNKIRSILTILSLAISLFLLTTILAFWTTLNRTPDSLDAQLRLVVRHAVSLANMLPMSYQQEIEKIPGVKQVVPMQWFGGVYIDEKNFFAQFATEPDKIFEMYSEYQIPPDQLESFIKDRTGVVVGKTLADRFNWKVGDRITLIGRIFPVNMELTIRGIYTAPTKEDASAVFFSREYWNEAMGRPNVIGTFAVKAKSIEDIPRIIDAIDARFQNSIAQTKTETEKAFQLSFVSMLGNVKLLIASVNAVVLFAILLVVANTMAIAMRERTREVAILKTVGFRRKTLLLLLISESLLICFLGWVLGCLGAWLIWSSVDLTNMGGGFLSQLYVTPSILGLGLIVAFLLGLFSAGIPVWHASQITVAQALRQL